MTSRNALALLLTAVSVGLLIPGLTQPVLTIVATMNMLGVTQEVFRQTQSVLEAVRTLQDSDNDFVAGLILFFSVTVPFLKALALVIIYRHRANLHRISAGTEPRTGEPQPATAAAAASVPPTAPLAPPETSGFPDIWDHTSDTPPSPSND